MTQEEKRAILAERVMGWHKRPAPYSIKQPSVWWFDKDHNTAVLVKNYRPDELRDQLAGVEGKIAQKGRGDEYASVLARKMGICPTAFWRRRCFLIRTAPPTDCVDALVEMLT